MVFGPSIIQWTDGKYGSYGDLFKFFFENPKEQSTQLKEEIDELKCDFFELKEEIKTKDDFQKLMVDVLEKGQQEIFDKLKSDFETLKKDYQKLNDDLQKFKDDVKKENKETSNKLTQANVKKLREHFRSELEMDFLIKKMNSIKTQEDIRKFQSELDKTNPRIMLLYDHCSFILMHLDNKFEDFQWKDRSIQEKEYMLGASLKAAQLANNESEEIVILARVRELTEELKNLPSTMVIATKIFLQTTFQLALVYMKTGNYNEAKHLLIEIQPFAESPAIDMWLIRNAILEARSMVKGKKPYFDLDFEAAIKHLKSIKSTVLQKPKVPGILCALADLELEIALLIRPESARKSKKPRTKSLKHWNKCNLLYQRALRIPHATNIYSPLYLHYGSALWRFGSSGISTDSSRLCEVSLFYFLSCPFDLLESICGDPKKNEWFEESLQTAAIAIERSFHAKIAIGKLAISTLPGELDNLHELIKSMVKNRFISQRWTFKVDGTASPPPGWRIITPRLPPQKPKPKFPSESESESDGDNQDYIETDSDNDE